MDNTSPLGFWCFAIHAFSTSTDVTKKYDEKNSSCKEALHVLLRLDRKLGKCNTKYGRYVYCTAAAWSEYFPEKFPRISQHLAENSRGPPSGLIIRLNIYIFHFWPFFRSPTVHYGGKRTLKRWREGYLPSPWTTLPDPTKQICLCPR